MERKIFLQKDLSAYFTTHTDNSVSPILAALNFKTTKQEISSNLQQLKLILLNFTVAGWYQRFEHKGGDSTTDLVSPALCNDEIFVEFSCSIITPILGRRTELHVLVTCNDAEFRGQPLHGVRGPVTSGKRVNFTLPACPEGQSPRVSRTWDTRSYRHRWSSTLGLYT